MKRLHDIDPCDWEDIDIPKTSNNNKKHLNDEQIQQLIRFRW